MQLPGALVRMGQPDLGAIPPVIRIVRNEGDARIYEGGPGRRRRLTPPAVFSVCIIPLPGQRLSIFSISGPERAKKLSIGVHGFCGKQRKSAASGLGEGSEVQTETESKIH